MRLLTLFWELFAKFIYCYFKYEIIQIFSKSFIDLVLIEAENPKRIIKNNYKDFQLLMFAYDQFYYSFIQITFFFWQKREHEQFF